MSEYSELAKLLNNLMMNDKKNNEVSIPIKELCGIPVYCDIVIRKGCMGKMIALHITSKITVWSVEDDMNGPDKVTLHCQPISINENIITTENLQELFSTLEKLKFNKFEGEFEKVDDSKTEIINPFLFIKKIKNIKPSFDECCVCNEDTKCFTICNHCLCYECMFKLKEVFEDEDDMCSGRIPCPICRQTIGN